MKIVIPLLVFAVLAGAVFAGGQEEGGPVTISYKSLAWLKKEQDLTKEVIAEWNKNHPDVNVEYLQGDWGTVRQELLTAFETGDVPDAYHYYVSPVIEWMNKGFLADLRPMLTDEMMADVPQNMWQLFTAEDGAIYALTFQWETSVNFYNKRHFRETGLEPPTLENQWSFEDFRQAGLKLSDPRKERYGSIAYALFNASRHVNENWAPRRNINVVLKESDGTFKENVTDEYMELMKWFHDLCYVDHVMPEGYATYPFIQGVLSGFIEGNYSILSGIGCWYRTILINESEGKDIEWGMLPGLKEDTDRHYGFIQTISVPERGKHKAETMEFLKYFWSTKNMGKIAHAAMIFPGKISSINLPEFNVKEYGWDLAARDALNMVVPDFVSLPGWDEFVESTKTINQEYLNDQISLEEWAKTYRSMLRETVDKANRNK